MAESAWDWLVGRVRQAPTPSSAAPPGFADRVLARLAARREAARGQHRVALVAALAASVLALAVGLWCADAIAAEWDRPPLAREDVLPLEPLP
jgi:hypothetical protein